MSFFWPPRHPLRILRDSLSLDPEVRLIPGTSGVADVSFPISLLAKAGVDRT
jgi:hypothetical protein